MVNERRVMEEEKEMCEEGDEGADDHEEKGGRGRWRLREREVCGVL